MVDAWNELSKRHGLLFDPMKDRVQTFGVADTSLIFGWPLSLSPKKARKFGFHGTVDPIEAAFETLQAFARMKVTAPMVVDHVEEVL